MRISILILLLFCSTESFAILGGKMVTIKEAPWQVAIVYYDNVIGGGVILTPNLILTAKHVFTGRNIENIKVVRGASAQQDFSSNTVDVYRVMMHSYMDAALIELKQPLQLSENIQAIDYKSSKNMNMYAEGNQTLVCGWGVGGSKSTLTGIDMKLISIEEALQINKLPYYAIPSYQFPALPLVGGIGGICSGDSGSPLVIWDAQQGHHVLIGVSIWSLGANCPTDPQHISVFGKVSNMLDWIDQYRKEIVGNSNISAYGEKYYVKNKPVDSYITWTLSNNLEQIGANNDTIIVINKSGEQVSNGLITATFTVGTKSMNLPTLQVAALPRVSLNVEIQESMQTGSELYANVEHSDNHCVWEFLGDSFTTSGINYMRFPLNSNGKFVLKAKLSHNGYSIILTDSLDITSVSEQGLSIYPNPAHNLITINLGTPHYSITSEKKDLLLMKEAYMKYPLKSYQVDDTKNMTAYIYDPIGVLVKKIDLDGKLSTLDISELAAGFYILNIKQQNALIGSKRFIKK